MRLTTTEADALITAREQAFTPWEDAMTRVIAGGCLFGGAELHQDAADRLALWVPPFEISGVDPNAFQPGDMLAIPSSVAVHPAFVGSRLRVIGRSWLLVTESGRLVWDLTLICADADPEDSRARYALPRQLREVTVEHDR